MAFTYEPIQSVTTSVNSQIITITDIPNTYTDLRLTIDGFFPNDTLLSLNYNNDTSALYSSTALLATSSVTSASTQSANNIALRHTFNGRGFIFIDILSYGASLFKTCLISSGTSGPTRQSIWQTGLYRNVAAINRIDITASISNGIGANTNVTLYGIKAA